VIFHRGCREQVYSFQFSQLCGTSVQLVLRGKHT
jgi:hypothetical protein